MKKIDLHVHSTASDGTFKPKELLSLAKEQNLSALALTDHDTTDGIQEALEASKELNIELIPGIELSTDYKGKEIHILGLYIDVKNADFSKQLADFKSSRAHRNVRMAEKLREEGFPITMEQIHQTFPDRILTRAHFARYLADHGYVKNMDQVFQKYLGDGCRCYVPREKISPFEAIDLIHKGGGLAFFAHPLLCNMNYDLLYYVMKSMADAGLDGIEAFYSSYSTKEEQNMKRFAEKLGILICGGSDFHGTNKPYIQLGSGRGNLSVPYTVLEDIKSKLIVSNNLL